MDRIFSRAARVALSLALAAAFSFSAFGQSAEIKKTYDEKLKALAKDNWDGKAELAKWAQENGLTAQAKALLNEVLKAKPEHEKARKLAGYVKYQNKWILESDLEKIRGAEREKEMKEKGWVKMKNGEWAPAADVAFLERGLVKHNDLWVTKEEKEKIDKGFTLVDGEWISPEEAENVRKGLFKVKGSWVSRDEADAYHSNWDTPWKLQTTHFHLITNLDRATAEQQIKFVEDTYERLFEIFKVAMAERPNIYLIATDSDFKDFEQKKAPSEHSSIFPGFISTANPERPGVALWEKNFGYLHIMHAVAHVYIDRVSKGSKDVPIWFEEAIASYATRFYDEKHKSWSIDNLKRDSKKLDSLRKFTDEMELSIDAYEESQRQITQAGLLAWYCLNGGNEGIKKTFLEAAASLSSGKKEKISKAVDAVLAKGSEIEKELKAIVK